MSFTTERQDAKDQLRRAAGDAADAGQHLKRAATVKAARVQDAIRSSATRLSGRAQGLAEHTKDQFRSGQGRALKLARERPAATTAVAVGLTVLLGLLFANRARLTHGAADLKRTALRRSRLRHRS